MSATLHPPTRRGAAPRNSAPSDHEAAATEAAGDRSPAASAGYDLTVGLAALALTLAAALPLDRVFTERSFVPLVALAAVVPSVVAWTLRRLGRGPAVALLASAGAWWLFATLAFAPETLRLGVVPSGETLSALQGQWRHGIHLLQQRPAPAAPDAALVLIAATGVWAVATAIQELVGRLRAAVRAVLMALVLWLVPLGLTPAHGRAWAWAAPLLAAAALVLLTAAGGSAARWGRWSPAPGTGTLRARLRIGVLNPVGWTLAAGAIAVGAVAAPLLPGYDNPPLYELRDVGGSTITSNPMVTIRSSLLDPGRRPLMRVHSPRPVYLRTTSLDVYSEFEEWTNAGIRGTPLRGGPVPFEVPIASPLELPVSVEVTGLVGAVLVPAPYQPTAVEGSITADLQYDRRLSTFTLNRGVRLSRGDHYAVRAALPAPAPERLDTYPPGGHRGSLTALPANVPDEVVALARSIVARAGATTPFAQALAIQSELRSWTYSLEPPQGHTGAAMLAFINSRIGYCEQYAGTMTVMLRALGIPARVAVGFTPGNLSETGDYVVTSANAHAWVEVLFPGEGWIAFEPTPRSDGNVLVPSAANLAPERTEAQERGEAPVDPADVTPEAEPPPEAGTDETEPQPQEPADAGSDAPGGGDGDGGRTWWPALLAVLALALAGGAWRLRVDPGSLADRERVVHAVARLERLGRGARRPRRPSETDHEYLPRLVPGDGALRLAELAAVARYARELPEASVREAEQLAGRMRAVLLARFDRRARLRIRLVAVLTGLRDELTKRRTGA